MATALALLDDADLPTTSQRGWSTYVEVLLFLRRPADGIGPLRLAAHRLTELDHNDAALRVAELATAAFLAGDRRSARRAMEMAREFVHDDNVAAYRRLVHRTFLRLATAMLADPPADARADALAAVARRAWDVAPDDEKVCLAAVRTFAHVGRRTESRELVEGTARTLAELGLNSETFHSRGLLEAVATSAGIA